MKTCNDYPGPCCTHCHRDEAGVLAGDLASGGLTSIRHGRDGVVVARVCCAKTLAARADVEKS